MKFTSYSLASMVATGIVLIIVGFSISRWLRKWARRRALLTADDARFVDDRPPVLFLRSFRDDQVSLSGAKLPLLIRLFDPGTIGGTLEELLVREFGYLGPVIAIGNPADPLPVLGAARKYCRGQNWREVVQNLMSESSLIVVGADRGDGLEWEISAITHLRMLDKTIFLLPPRIAGDRGAADLLLRTAGVHRTTFPPPDGRKIIAVLLSSSRRILWVVASQVTEIEYEIALRIRRVIDAADWRPPGEPHRGYRG